MKKTLAITFLVIMIIGNISCTRSLTPSQAAQGRAHCGDTLR